MTNLSIKLYGFITGMLHREEGQDLIEYALLGGLIALALIAASLFLVPAIAGLGSGITACVDFNAGTTCSPMV